MIKVKSQNAIVLWSNSISSLKMIKFPHDTTSSEFAREIYKLENDNRSVKLTVINGREYLMVIDEPRYVKLFRFVENKLILYKQFFVHSRFGIEESENISEAVFSEGMLLMNSYALLLHEKVTEQDYDDDDLEAKNVKLDYMNNNYNNKTMFLNKSDNFYLLKQTCVTDLNIYECQKRADIAKVYKMPMLNSRQLKNYEYGQLNEDCHQMFLHSTVKGCSSANNREKFILR